MRFRIIFVSFCIFTLGFFLVQCTSDKDKIHKQLRLEIDELNAKSPIQINSSMRLDSCVLLPNNDMEHYYTITDTVDYDASRFMDIANDVKYAAKTEPGMADIRSYGVSMRYNYRNRDGSPAFSFLVTPKDYK